MKNAFALTKRLMHLSKQGQKAPFLKIVDETNIFRKLQQGDPVGAALLIYSFSRLDIKDLVYWRELERCFIINVINMNEVDVAMAAWGFSKLPSKNEQIWGLLERRFNESFTQFKIPKSGVLLSYSFAKAHRKDSPKIWEQLETVLSQFIDKLQPHEISMVIWSFSKMDKGTNAFWSRIEQRAVNIFPDFHLGQTAIVAYSFAHARRSTPKFSKLTENMVLKINPRDNMKLKDISYIIWALSKQGNCSEEYWTHMTKIVMQNISRFSFLDQITVIWSFFVADKGDTEVWNKLIEEIDKTAINTPNIISADDLTTLIYILHKREITYKSINSTLGNLFIQRLKSRRLFDDNIKTISHLTIFEQNPELWDNEVEQIYIEQLKLVASQKRNLSFLHGCALIGLYLHNVSKKFVDELAGAFGVVMQNYFLQEKKVDTLKYCAVIGCKIGVIMSRHNEELSSIGELQSRLEKTMLHPDVIQIFQKHPDIFALVVRLSAVLKISENSPYWRELHKIKDQIQVLSPEATTDIIHALLAKLDMNLTSKNMEPVLALLTKFHAEKSRDELLEMEQKLFEQFLTTTKTYQDLVAEFKKNDILSQIESKALNEIRKIAQFNLNARVTEEDKEMIVKEQESSLRERNMNEEENDIELKASKTSTRPFLNTSKAPTFP